MERPDQLHPQKHSAHHTLINLSWQVGVVAGGKWLSEISHVMSQAHQTIPEDSTFRHVCTVLLSSFTGSTAEDADRLLKVLCEAAFVEQNVNTHTHTHTCTHTAELAG
jgi:hypothetical protein